VVYALTTSTGMTAIIVALLGGVLVGVLVMLAGIGAGVAFGLGTASAVAFFAAVGVVAGRYFIRDQTSLDVRFPSASAGVAPDNAQNR
jgi:hypothetical protein